MQKCIPFLALLLAFGCSPKVAPVVDADGTDWNAAAAEYTANPAALKALVEGCETSEAQLATTRAQLDRYRADSGSSAAEITQAKAATAAAQQEVNTLRAQIAQLQQQRNDQVDTDEQIVSGVIFQVQLGAFAQNKVDPNLATGNALDLQDQNGLQKFVVSQFRTYANARMLKDRLVQMGATGAFVVAKNNGQRIDIQEALRLSGQQ